MLLPAAGIWTPREEFKQHAEKKFRAAEDKIWETTEKAGLRSAGSLPKLQVS